MILSQNKIINSALPLLNLWLLHYCALSYVLAIGYLLLSIIHVRILHWRKWFVIAYVKIILLIIVILFAIFHRKYVGLKVRVLDRSKLYTFTFDGHRALFSHIHGVIEIGREVSIFAKCELHLLSFLRLLVWRRLLSVDLPFDWWSRRMTFVVYHVSDPCVFVYWDSPGLIGYPLRILGGFPRSGRRRLLLLCNALTGVFARSVWGSTFILPAFIGLTLFSQEIVDVYESFGFLDRGSLEWWVWYIDLVLDHGRGILGMS